MGKKREGGYLGSTPSSWSASVRPGMWNMRSQFELNKDGSWPEPPPIPVFLERSLRFNSSDSAYLSRTPASAGNRKTWTWAGWVKRSALGSFQDIWGNGDASALNGFLFRFDNGDKLDLYDISGSVQWRKVTTQVFRDASAWYHFVISYNTANATAADRVRIYINGVRIDSFSSSSDPSLNYDGYINNTNAHSIGRTGAYNGLYLSAYLADIHFIDGQALDPTSFGEFDDNGIWQPIDASGLTYGTNGFHLDFADNSTAAALGTDTSGNSNTWTVNNISVASGAGNDSVVDVPTNGTETDTGSGGEVKGNYATFNPIRNSIYPATTANGNLELSVASGYVTAAGTIAVSTGKWYWEMTLLQDDTSTPGYQWAGVVRSDDHTSGAQRIFTGTNPAGVQYWGNTGNLNNTQAYGASFTKNDVIGVAFDVDAGSITFYKNGVSQGASTFNLVANASYYPSAGGGGNFKWAGNFGQRPFAYTAPSGFKALNTASLPAPVVTKPSEYMDVALYQGNGSTQTISGLEFSPDLIWVKSRSAAYSTTVYDTVRGAYKSLATAVTNAEGTNTSGLSAFNSDGFSLDGENNVLGSTNVNAVTYVAWNWDAGSSTVTNEDGSITSSVRTNNYLSIVTYTGTGSAGTVGHGLGVAPSMIIAKRRNSSGAWYVQHASLGATARIQLNETSAQTTGTSLWNSTSPTSTVFSISSDAEVNASGGTFVVYAFAPVESYSAFGSYTGNGSSQFVYLGFRPRWVLIKNAGQVNDWFLMDSARSTYNEVNTYLYPNSSAAELTYGWIDFLSNGFKVNNTGTGNNNNGVTMIYAAFAESPFQYARAR